MSDTAPPLTVHKAFNNPAPAAPASTGRNWIRDCHITVGSGDIDLSTLRVRFEITSQTTQSLAAAHVIISNVSRQTYAKLANEFTKIRIKAGYVNGASGIVFSGSIVDSQYGEKENWTDPLLQIWARSLDAAYNQTMVSRSLAPGATPQDIVNTCLEALKPFGVTMGQVVGVDLSQPKFPRGYVLAGMTRDYLREVATSKQATWNLNNGQLNIIAKGVATGPTGVTLNQNTGLIGQVIQRPTGIMVRSLINPAIRVDAMVQIDQKDVVKLNVNDGGVDQDAVTLSTALANQGAADGLYRVLQVTTTGDTRGQPWYQDLVCIGAYTGSTNAAQIGEGLA